MIRECPTCHALTTKRTVCLECLLHYWANCETGCDCPTCMTIIHREWGRRRCAAITDTIVAEMARSDIPSEESVP